MGRGATKLLLAMLCVACMLVWTSIAIYTGYTLSSNAETQETTRQKDYESLDTKSYQEYGNTQKDTQETQEEQNTQVQEENVQVQEEPEMQNESEPDEPALDYCRVALYLAKLQLDEDAKIVEDGKVSFIGIATPVLREELKNIKYTSGDFTIQGDTAVVPVVIEYSDYSMIVRQSMLDYWENAIESGFDSVDAAAYIAQSAWNNNIATMTPDKGYITVYFDCVKKSNGEWGYDELRDDTANAIIQAAYGNIVDTISNSDALMQEYLNS